MKNLVSRVAVGSCLIAACSFSKAQMPGTDYMNLANDLIGNIRDMIEHSEYVTMYNQLMGYAGDLAGLGADSSNNAWANVALRTNNHKAGVHEMRVYAMAEPAVNASGSIAASLLHPCPAKDVIKGLEAEDRGIDNELTAQQKRARSEPAKTLDDRYQEIIDRALQVSECVAPDDGDEAVSESKYLDPLSAYSLVSGEIGALLHTAETTQYVNDYIDLIAPPYVRSSAAKDLGDINDTANVNALVDEAYARLPRSIFHKLMVKRMNIEGSASELSALQYYADDTFNGNDAATGSTASQISTSDLAGPGLVWRNIAVMKAFRVRMALEKYKASLDQEVLTASRLGHRLRSGDL